MPKIMIKIVHKNGPIHRTIPEEISEAQLIELNQKIESICKGKTNYLRLTIEDSMIYFPIQYLKHCTISIITITE